MLAASVKKIEDLRFPLIATPKLDGVRTLIVDGKAVSRTFKHVPNIYSYEHLSTLPEGLDGEYMIEGQPFNEISKAWRTREGDPGFVYYVFDWAMNQPYDERITKLAMWCKNYAPAWVKFTPAETVYGHDQLEAFERKVLQQGYEGVCLRDPKGPYKFGRSTFNEHYLLKLKRWEDSEATVLDVLEKQRNANDLLKDAFGLAKRSSHKANKQGLKTLGAFVVKDKRYGTFNIGVFDGLRDEDKQALWNERKALVGEVVKYKYQEVGLKDVPRIPVFLGFRDRKDM
jgi:DNA ligase-1